MTDIDDWAPHIRMLLYPIIFEVDPIHGLDRVIRLIEENQENGTLPAHYLTSIRMALASSDTYLSEIIPLEHSEKAIRLFLTEVERRLALMVKVKPAGVVL